MKAPMAMLRLEPKKKKRKKLRRTAIRMTDVENYLQESCLAWESMRMHLRKLLLEMLVEDLIFVYVKVGY